MVCQIQANVGGVVVPVLDTIVVSALLLQQVTFECINVLTKCFVYLVKAPKYTLSRRKRNDKHGVAGIGWTEDGFNKFNELYDSVHEDRTSRGVVFNNELLNVFLERQRAVKVNPNRHNTRKRKTIPRDDMGPIDRSGESATDDNAAVVPV